MTRLFALLTGLTLLAACTEHSSQDPMVDLGEFHLGHNIVVMPNPQVGPISRSATKEEWIAALTRELDARFRRYDGDQLYHFGISIDGYMLAPPGVPVIYNPRSALFLSVTIWDDAAASKLNPEVKRFTVFETTTGESLVVGSGHKRTREQQMAGLSRNAAAVIEEWMMEQHRAEGWFNRRPDTVSAPLPAAPVPPAAVPATAPPAVAAPAAPPAPNAPAAPAAAPAMPAGAVKPPAAPSRPGEG
ncbi:MAG: hypothetical protein ACK5MY_06630 [Jhaorihella sp.]